MRDPCVCLPSVFLLSSLSVNQDMLWAADDDDDSVMWECHQSLGTVTGFCFSASDAQTVAFSALLLLSLSFCSRSWRSSFQVSFAQVKSRCRCFNYRSLSAKSWICFLISLLRAWIMLSSNSVHSKGGNASEATLLIKKIENTRRRIT